MNPAHFNLLNITALTAACDVCEAWSLTQFHVIRSHLTYSCCIPIFCFLLCLRRIRDSAIGIATGYGLDDRGVGVRVPRKSRIFSFPPRPDRLWGPPSLLSKEYRGALSPGVKRLVREADHSPQTSAKVKIMWIYTSTPYTPSCRSAYRENLTFTSFANSYNLCSFIKVTENVL
jgi:hypothetical protein